MREREPPPLSLTLKWRLAGGIFDKLAHSKADGKYE